jgi:hypothetical protein
MRRRELRVVLLPLVVSSLDVVSLSLSSVVELVIVPVFEPLFVVVLPVLRRFEREPLVVVLAEVVPLVWPDIVCPLWLVVPLVLFIEPVLLLVEPLVWPFIVEPLVIEPLFDVLLVVPLLFVVPLFQVVSVGVVLAVTVPVPLMVAVLSVIVPVPVPLVPLTLVVAVPDRLLP